MKRHASLLLALLSIGCATQDRTVPQASPATAGERPNLLFIITDDQRFDMLGVVHPFLETPNMDRRSMRCTAYHAGTEW